MEPSDKQELLSAIKDVANAVAAFADHVEERFTELTREMRSGYEKLDRRLEAVEESTAAMSETIDKLLEGDTRGTGYITLTRPEYDAVTSGLQIPNRFLESHPAD